ncbi:MAG: ATP-binding protein [Gammaproteobacteria bacterium]|nr:ATP-binding protein [Gammaproteobacteria bacterium]
MHSLLVRIFLAFWLIIAVTIGVAAISGYAYSERLREALENFEVSDNMLEASQSLESGGREGLEDWLRNLPKSSPMNVYVIDQNGNDLLKRRVPYSIIQAMRRFGGRNERPRRPFPDSDNLRPARPLTQLIDADRRVYTFFVVPNRRQNNWFNERTATYFLIFAVFLSAAVSYLLARAISNPISRFREAAVAISAGDFNTRVAAQVGDRNDEIGHLARDFDSMADELQHAWQQKTELTRNVSHELRSPLARLRVALELARRKAGDMSEFAKMDNETERLDELIGQILDYSKLEPRSDDQPSRVNIADLVAQIVDDVRYECRSGGIEGVTVELVGDSRAEMDGYAAALGSAIENVVRNAVRYSPPGGTVTVSLRQQGALAIIDVTDQGPGVDAPELQQLFEPFFRARSTLDNKSLAGSGLGLAIAHRAVQKNGGSITAHNVDGGGLRVRIELPATA